MAFAHCSRGARLVTGRTQPLRSSRARPAASERGLPVHEKTRDQVRRALEAAGNLFIESERGRGIMLLNEAAGSSLRRPSRARWRRDFGDGLGAKAGSMIVLAAPYEVTDTSVDSQMISLKSAGADVFVDITIAKFAAQAARKAAEMGWKPVHICDQGVVPFALKSDELANAKGVLSSSWLKDVYDPIWNA